MQERKLRIKGEIWRILKISNGEKIKETRKTLEKEIEELEVEILCIEGDFNARMGEGDDRNKKDRERRR